jgi:hypothetical protein
MSNEEHYFGRKCLPVEIPAERQQIAMEDIHPSPHPQVASMYQRWLGKRLFSDNCLSPLSTIFQLYRGCPFNFIGGGNRRKSPTCHKSLFVISTKSLNIERSLEHSVPGAPKQSCSALQHLLEALPIYNTHKRLKKPTGENHQPVTSHWQSLSHNVVHL